MAVIMTMTMIMVMTMTMTVAMNMVRLKCIHNSVCLYDFFLNSLKFCGSFSKFDRWWYFSQLILQHDLFDFGCRLDVLERMLKSLNEKIEVVFGYLHHV
jgi:hypothetical protein